MRLWGLLIAVFVLVGPASADSDPEREAVTLLTDGAELMRRGELEPARAKFLAARRLVPERANPYRLLGLVEARLGNCAEAVANLDEFLRRASLDDARRAEAQAVRDDCQQQLRPKPLNPVIVTPPKPPPPKPTRTRWYIAGGVTAVVIGAIAVGLAIGRNDPYSDATQFPDARWQ